MVIRLGLDWPSGVWDGSKSEYDVACLYNNSPVLITEESNNWQKLKYLLGRIFSAVWNEWIFPKKKNLNYVCHYAFVLCSFIRFTPLSFTEVSLQCINCLLRHTGNTERSVIWVRTAAVSGDMGWDPAFIKQWNCIGNYWGRMSRMTVNRINKQVFIWADRMANRNCKNQTFVIKEMYRQLGLDRFVDVNVPFSVHA